MGKILLLLILGCGLILGYVKYIESRAVFFPVKTVEFYPSLINLSFQDLYITTPDKIKINAWLILHPKAKYTLLFCHGNAGNNADRLDKLKMLWDLGLNILIIDYRGYGKSEGHPSEQGLYQDAEAAYEYLVNDRKILPEQIILYGESLGTSVVIDLAARVKVRALIVEGGFSSGRDMARILYPFLSTFLFSDRFNSLEKIKKIEAPKLFIHSPDDEIVPFKLAKKLYNAASGAKEFIEINGDHNNAFLDSQEKYLSSISAFIEKL